MLPDSFFDWWFSPWTYVLNPESYLPLAKDVLGQRDGYRIWCKQASVTTDLPKSFDTNWTTVVTDDAIQLRTTARLFAGIIAARERDQTILNELSLADRKWCLSIAATQPLLICRTVSYVFSDTIETRGLLELVRRMEHGFPGLWSRLRLMLDTLLAERVTGLLPIALTAEECSDQAIVRAQRCWRLCRSRVEMHEEVYRRPT